MYGHSKYRTTSLLSKMFIIWVRVTCKIGLVTYGSQHALHFLSRTTFVCTSLQHWKYRSYMDILHIEWLLYYVRHFLSCLKLHVICYWRVTFPDMHHGRSLMQRYRAYTVMAYISLFGAQLYRYAWQQNSCNLWLLTTHQTMALQPMIQSFIRTKLARYITCCSAFPINRVHIIKLLLYIYTSFKLCESACASTMPRFRCQGAKNKLGVKL